MFDLDGVIRSFTGAWTGTTE